MRTHALIRLGAALALLLIAGLAVGGAGAAEPAKGGGPRTSAAAGTLTFAAVADARVEEAKPTTNFGTLTRLGTDGDAGVRLESVLRFDLSGITGTVTDAKLRLWVVSDGTVDGPAVYPAGSDWTEAGVTWATRPQATGPAVVDMSAAAVSSWVEVNVTPLVTRNGSLSFLLKQPGGDGVSFYSRQGTYKPQLVVTTSADPVVMAAGDIACKPDSSVTAITCRHQYTSDLLLGEPGLTHVLPLGDTQYEDAQLAEFMGAGAYDATWGRLKSISKPVPGNHEYHLPEATGYFDYFGELAGERGRGYYSYDVGAWHLIALNSEISAAAGSEQEQWLRSDLAATTENCILAYWHQPRFSSGSHGAMTGVGPLWDALYEARADVILNAHDHDYERFAPQNPLGQADPVGIREFVVGTGGASHSPFADTIQPNSQVRDASTFGVIKLLLHASSYEWQFVPESGGTFTDSGSADCHDAPGAVLKVRPAAGPPPLAVTADASGSTDPDSTPIASYTFDFGDGSPVVGPQRDSKATHTYAVDGVYTVTVTVTDTGGLTGTATAAVTVSSNLVRNAGFENDASGWNTSGSGPNVALTRVPGGSAGEWAAQLANTGTAAATCVLNDSPNWVTQTSPGTYTGGIWVRADTPGATLKLRLREYAGTTLVGSATTQAVLGTSWQHVTVAYTATSPGSSLDFNAYVSNAAPGTCFFADDASLGFDSNELPPVAALTVTPASGLAPLTVTADASGSTDTDAFPIESFAFDFGDGSAVGPQPGPTAVHTYAVGGTFTVTVTVRDTAGLSSTATAQVVVRPNFVRNSGFETDTSGWNTSGSGPGVELTRVSGGHTGEWAAQLANTGTAAATCLLNDSPSWVTTTSAGTYTAALWARADSEGATLKLRLREWSGGTLAGTTTTLVTLTTSWQRVSVSYTSASPGSSSLDFNAYVSNAPPGTCFYADGVSIELN